MQALNEILAMTVQVQPFTKLERIIVAAQFASVGSDSGFPVHCHSMTEEETSASLAAGSKKGADPGGKSRLLRVLFRRAPQGWKFIRSMV